MSIFKNRVALITGASGEIGKKLAFELNKKGASIILAGRRREVLNNIGKNQTSKKHFCQLMLK